ncbi:hypothetical protein [Bosea sp. OAE506]|uniref:hypothetical protein n=1 Tax=Bosea sp. OAE506 TaxID=2663870 RepID=UPI00178B4246
MPTTRTLVERVRGFRVEEQELARASSDVNLLAHYPAFLDLINQLVGGLDGSSPGGSPELFQPESIAHLAEDVRVALREILEGPRGRAVVDDVQATCLALLSEKDRHALGPSACQDVGELAVRDAMLAGVSFWLHDHAMARPSRAARSASKPRSDAFRKRMSETSKQAWAKRQKRDAN